MLGRCSQLSAQFQSAREQSKFKPTQSTHNEQIEHPVFVVAPQNYDDNIFT